MRKLISFTIFFYLLTGAVFAQSQAGGRGTVDKPQVQEGATAEQIETTVGQTFSVTLDSNPTTGYKWQLAKPLDEGILKLVGSEYKKPATKLVGAGGKEIWVFKATAKGRTSIRLKYVRSWEKGVQPVKEAAFTVIVR